MRYLSSCLCPAVLALGLWCSPSRRIWPHSSHKPHAPFAPARRFALLSEKPNSLQFTLQKPLTISKALSLPDYGISQINVKQQIMQLGNYFSTVFPGYCERARWAHWIQRACKASVQVDSIKVCTICQLRGCRYSQCVWTLCRSIWSIQQALMALTAPLCFPAKGTRCRVTPLRGLTVTFLF